MTSKHLLLVILIAGLSLHGSLKAQDKASPNTGPKLTPIFTIQGTGLSSTLVGHSVTTRGVVTLLTNNGFFMQDPVGDGDPRSSDGIFVFTGDAPTMKAGQYVQLTGVVKEYNPRAARMTMADEHSVTEIIRPTTIQALPGDYRIKPTPVSLPQSRDDELEQYQGMLVTLGMPLTVSQNYFLGRFGQLTLSAGGRLEHATNRYRPNTPAARELAKLNARSFIVLDDSSAKQQPNPTPYLNASDHTLRVGDTVSGLTGVIDYGLISSSSAGPTAYKIHPLDGVNFTRANPRPAAPGDLGGNVVVASANLQNFFTTFKNGQTAQGGSDAGCAPANTRSACRGAANLIEFNRQRDKLVAMLGAIKADVVTLMEVQNNGSTAAQSLVDKLNAALGPNTYALVSDPQAWAGANTGEPPSTGALSGTDAIKVAMIYQSATLKLVGVARADTDSAHKRPSLAQTFALPNGTRFTVVANHFKSRRCDGAVGADLDLGDGQGCFNAMRIREAQAVTRFLSKLQAETGEKRVLLVGDFNTYAQEDPLQEFIRLGYQDVSAAGSKLPYSFVYDGESGALDHALASKELSPHVSGALEWHINADEPALLDYNTEFRQPSCTACAADYYAATPYRASDHDPLVIGLNLPAPAAASPDLRRKLH